MGSPVSILDLSAWASELGPVFRKALDPATPVQAHLALAEQATECMEQCALLGDRGPDGEAPWRALLVGDDCFLALEDGFAVARFDASNLISLRVETYEGRRWSVLHTGRGLAAFRQAALGRGTGTGLDPVLKVSGFGEGRLLFSQAFHPKGGGTAQPETPGTPGLQSPMEFSPALLGAGAALMRRAVESLKTTREMPEPVAPLPAPAVEPPLLAEPPAPNPPPMPSYTPSAPEPPLPPAAPAAATARWRLVGLTGHLAGQVIPVPDLAVVGRDKSADIPIENLTVSRRHAELRPTGLGMVLKDLGSANGTWFEKQQLIGPVLLKNGDTFTLGECAFRVERL
jgi:hypothetical protein